MNYITNYKKGLGFEKYFSQEKGSADEEVCEALG
jgi:hypothetical protein